MKTKELMDEDYQMLGPVGRVKYLWLLWTWQLVSWLGKKLGRPWWWNGGRHTDGDPTVCPECKWVGRVRDCVHGYQDDGSGEDVEGCDECPECGCGGV